MTDFRELAKPLHPESVFKVQAEQGYVELKGTFQLPPLDDGTAFRLRQAEVNATVLRISFETAEGPYRLEFDRASGNTLGLYRDGQRLVDDQSRWYAYRDGVLDIRYVDSELSIARGTQTLWSFPLAAAPTNTLLEITGRLQLFQHTRLPDIEPWQDPYGIGELRSADSLDWKRPAAHRYRPPDDGSRLEMLPGGSVSLLNPAGKDPRSASATYRSHGPCVITCRVDDCSHASGIGFSLYDRNQRTTYFAKKGERFVLCRDPFNAGDVGNYEKRGFVYTAPFYLRTIYGLDFIDFEASPDGVHWSIYDRLQLTQQHTMSLHVIELQLAGRTEGQSQHVRLSHAHLHQQPLFEEQADWIQNANRALINGWGPASLKQNASIDYLLRGLGDPESIARTFADTQDAIPFMRPYRWGGQPRSVDFEAVMRWHGRNMIATREFDTLEQSLDTWYREGYETTRHRSSSDRYGPPALVREALFRAWKAKDWANLRVQALKYNWLASPSRENLLAVWMLDQAEAHLDDVPDAEEGVSTKRRHWPHPLRISPDRATVNLLGEMLAALEDNDPEQACKVLVRGELSATLVGTEHDANLYKPSGIVVKEILESHPDMRQILIDQFNPVGMIRVGRASAAGDAAELERLADQFAGTPAARKALALLGDRDLSMGNFEGALHRFETLIPYLDGEAKVQLRAKRNLALALGGHRPKDAIAVPVQLEGRLFSAPEFASLIDSCLVEISGESPVEQLVVKPLEGGTSVSLQPFITNLLLAVEHPIASVQQGSILALQQDQLLQVVDFTQGVVRYTHGVALDKRATKAESFRPLFHGERLLTVKKDGKAYILQCLNVSDFAIAWEHRFTESLTSDPVVMDGRLYVATRSANELLYLHRLNWNTGSPEARTLLIRYPRPDKYPEIIRPQVVGGHLILPIRGSLMACDAWGNLVWVRRLPYVPYNVDSHMFADSEHPQVVAIDEGRMVVLAPCSPDIFCIDATNGRTQWQRFLPDRRYLIGRAGDSMLVRNRYSVEALRLGDGHTSERRPVVADQTAFLLQPDDELVEIRLDRSRPEDLVPKRRRTNPVSWKPAAARFIQVGDDPKLRMEPGVEGFVDAQACFVVDGKAYALASFFVDAKDRQPKMALAKIVFEDARPPAVKPGP